MEDPIMKAIREDTSEIAEIERRLAGSIPADPELRDRLEARDKFRRTHLQLLHDAEVRGFRKGFEQTLAELRAKRIEEGLELGHEEEREKRRATARRLKAEGRIVADIAEMVGIPEGEIREL